MRCSFQAKLNEELKADDLYFSKHNTDDSAHIIQTISPTTSYSNVLLARRACKKFIDKLFANL